MSANRDSQAREGRGPFASRSNAQDQSVWGRAVSARGEHVDWGRPGLNAPLGVVVEQALALEGSSHETKEDDHLHCRRHSPALSYRSVIRRRDK